MSVKLDSASTVPVRAIVYAADGITPVTSTTAHDVKLSDVAAAMATPATVGARGTVTRQAAFADIGAAPSQANFNTLLASLRAAGIILP